MATYSEPWGVYKNGVGLVESFPYKAQARSHFEYLLDKWIASGGSRSNNPYWVEKIKNRNPGFQIVVPKGTMRNPSKRRSLISKIRKILSNPGGVALDVLGAGYGASYADQGAKAITGLYGGGRKKRKTRKAIRSKKSKLRRR